MYNNYDRYYEDAYQRGYEDGLDSLNELGMDLGKASNDEYIKFLLGIAGTYFHEIESKRKDFVTKMRKALERLGMQGSKIPFSLKRMKDSDLTMIMDTYSKADDKAKSKFKGSLSAALRSIPGEQDDYSPSKFLKDIKEF